MAFITNFSVSNKSDFVVDFSATDVDTGEDIDFTGATLSIKIAPENCTPLISASIGSGITQPTSTVLELTVTAAQMAVLRPGSYLIGGVFGLNGATIQLLIGTLAVYDGIASV